MCLAFVTISAAAAFRVGTKVLNLEIRVCRRPGTYHVVVVRREKWPIWSKLDPSWVKDPIGAILEQQDKGAVVVKVVVRGVDPHLFDLFDESSSLCICY